MSGKATAEERRAIDRAAAQIWSRIKAEKRTPSPLLERAGGLVGGLSGLGVVGGAVVAVGAATNPVGMALVGYFTVGGIATAIGTAGGVGVGRTLGAWLEEKRTGTPVADRGEGSPTLRLQSALDDVLGRDRVRELDPELRTPDTHRGYAGDEIGVATGNECWTLDATAQREALGSEGSQLAGGRTPEGVRCPGTRRRPEAASGQEPGRGMEQAPGHGAQHGW